MQSMPMNTPRICFTRTAYHMVDTRKTTPGLRALEKAAVRAGGGRNHRFGLFDMVMVKDNHLAAAGKAPGELQANLSLFRRQQPGVRVELEADRLDQVRDFLKLEGVDVILLDNMTTAQLAEAVALRGDRPVKLEASGGVTLETVNAIAATGVDFISVGALTHSAPAADFCSNSSGHERGLRVLTLDARLLRELRGSAVHLLPGDFAAALGVPRGQIRYGARQAARRGL